MIYKHVDGPSFSGYVGAMVAPQASMVMKTKTTKSEKPGKQIDKNSFLVTLSEKASDTKTFQDIADKPVAFQDVQDVRPSVGADGPARIKTCADGTSKLWFAADGEPACSEDKLAEVFMPEDRQKIRKPKPQDGSRMKPQDGSRMKTYGADAATAQPSWYEKNKTYVILGGSAIALLGLFAILRRKK